MSSYVEVCHCGHAKETHFEHKDTCLGMACDCPKYVHRDDPKPKRRSPRPNHPRWCRCLGCLEWNPDPPEVPESDAPDDVVITPLMPFPRGWP